MHTHLTTYIQFLQEKSKSSATITNYYYDILQFITFIKTQNILEITENDSRAYLAFILESVKMSNPSINRKMISLRLFYEYLRRKGSMTSNPFDFFHKLDVTEKPASILTPDMINHVFEFLNISKEKAIQTDSKTALLIALRNDLIFRLILFTGLRKTEITNIRLADIIGSPGHSFILKIRNKGVRSVPLPDKLIPSLTAYLKQRNSDCVSLFLDDAGKKPVSHFVVHRLFRTISIVMNVRITPGMVRRYFALQLSAVSSDVLSIHNLLGNSKLETTLRHTTGIILKFPLSKEAIHPPLIRPVPSKVEGPVPSPDTCLERSSAKSRDVGIEGGGRGGFTSSAS